MAARGISKGFKITLAILVCAVFILTGAAAGFVYWQNARSRESDRVISARISELANDNKEKKKTGAGTTDAKPVTSVEDKYSGWQTYKNKTYALSIKIPSGWTYMETSGSLHLSILGPATAGGVITHACAFSVFVEDVSPGTMIEAYSDAAMKEPQGSGTSIEDGPTTISGNPGRRVVDSYQEVGYPWKRLCVWTIKNNKAYTFDYQASTDYESTNYYSTHLATAELILASIVID
ncbi:MAG: hypothetical protein WC891_05145 [Actinomycetota bacterium]